MGTSIEQSALAAGQRLSQVEDAAVGVFGLNETAGEATLQDYGRKLGMSDSQLQNISLDGLKMAAKHYLDKATSAYELLSQLLAVKKKAADNVIGNIR